MYFFFGWDVRRVGKLLLRIGGELVVCGDLFGFGFKLGVFFVLFVLNYEVLK